MKRTRTVSTVNALTLICATFAVVLLSADRSLNLYDEGVILEGAVRIMAGDMPHRDFYANYGPGQFYVLGALFKLFQPQILIERVWGAIIKAALALVVLLISRRLSSSILANATSAFCVVWLALADNSIWPAWTALTLSLISVLLLFDEFDQTQSKFGTVISGACLGAATLFRYDIGFLVGCAELIALTTHGLCARSSNNSKARNAPALLVAGLALVCGPLALVYVATGTTHDFLFDVVMFPAKFYASTRSLPFPVPFSAAHPNSLSAYIVYFPLMVCLAAMPMLWRLRKSVSPSEISNASPSYTLEWKLLLMVLVTLAFFAKGLVRVSAVHMTPAVLPAAITFMILLGNFSRKKNSAQSGLLVIVGILAFCPTTNAISQVGERLAINGDWLVRMSGKKWDSEKSQIVSGSCLAAKYDNSRCIAIPPDQYSAARYVSEHTMPNDAIFVGVPHHDHIFVNDVAFYFLADRRPATKWYHFDPGLQSGEKTQNSIIEELKTVRPRFVIIDSEWEGIDEPNASAKRTGVVLLDEYIASHYRGAATFGSVSILALKAQTPE